MKKTYFVYFFFRIFFSPNNRIKFFITCKKNLEKLIQLKIITGQGKKINDFAEPQQGYWFSRNDFKKKNILFYDYFQEIKNEKDLVNYIQNN